MFALFSPTAPIPKWQSHNATSKHAGEHATFEHAVEFGLFPIGDFRLGQDGGLLDGQRATQWPIGRPTVKYRLDRKGWIEVA